MRRATSILAAVALAAATRSARADTPHAEVGLALGYMAPLASFERGSRLSDVTFGAAAVAPDVAFRVHPLVAAGARVRYGALIPTLCTSASECIASLGVDWTLGPLVRFALPAIGPLRPRLDLDLGYEWASASLSDRDALSTRRYRGFTAGFAVHAPLDSSTRFALEPIANASIGVFQRTSLVAPGVESSGGVAGTAAHGWLFFGLRGALMTN